MKSFKANLASKGYTFQRWINAEETDSIFAVNPHGNTVIISVTAPVPGYSGKTHNFLISNQDTVPKDIYQESLAIFADLTGMCCITPEGMCFVEDDQVVHYTHNVCNTHSKHLESSKYLLRYPIFKYSELLKNPEDILKNSDIIYYKLSNNSVRSIIQIMEDFHDTLNNLNAAAKRIFETTHTALKYLSETLDVETPKIISSASNNSPDHSKLKDLMVSKESYVQTIANSYYQIASDISRLDQITRRIDSDQLRIQNS